LEIILTCFCKIFKKNTKIGSFLNVFFGVLQKIFKNGIKFKPYFSSIGKIQTMNNYDDWS
jgi:hypothetical protein